MTARCACAFMLGHSSNRIRANASKSRAETSLDIDVALGAVGFFLGRSCAAFVAPSARAQGEAVYRKLCCAIQLQHVRVLFGGAVAPIRLGATLTAPSRRKAATLRWPA